MCNPCVVPPCQQQRTDFKLPLKTTGEGGEKINPKNLKTLNLVNCHGRSSAHVNEGLSAHHQGHEAPELVDALTGALMADPGALSITLIRNPKALSPAPPRGTRRRSWSTR